VHSLSVVLPAFNESANIAGAVRAALSALDERRLHGEVIVVDDGSVDDTRDIATMLPDSRVRVFHHPRNRGYGAALRTGIENARMSHIFFTDADLQFDLGELARLVDWVRGYDIVVGYRQHRRDPTSRRVNAWLWNQLVGQLFDLPVRDIDCAFKLFDRRVFVEVPIRSVGAFVNTEVLVRARAAGFRIREVPVSHFPREAGSATGANPRVIVRAFSELVRLRGELESPVPGGGVLAARAS
jgi:glycosyltransferase involved in cell wall biosynthesis